MGESKPHWVRKPRGRDAIIFVHGVLSQPQNAWRSGSTFWPELLCSVDELRDVGVYVFSYRNDVFSGSYRISDAVDSLRDYLDLDGLMGLSRLLFVCHSMGGIVVRQFLVNLQSELIEKQIKIGLFLIASPSLGAEYANLFAGLAKALRNEQVQALRFADNNTFLNDLDRNFINLKESGKLSIVGKELVEDEFIVLPKFIGSYVVKPFSGAKYFGKSIKIAHSNHFTIAEATGPSTLQHRLLVLFAKRVFDISNETTLPDFPELPESPGGDEEPEKASGKPLGRRFALIVLALACALLTLFVTRSLLTKPGPPVALFSRLIPLPIIDRTRQIHALAAADLDNSGKRGLITVNRKATNPSDPTNDDGSISVLLGVTDSGFQSVTTYKTDKVAYGIKVADLNNDHIEDVVVTNQTPAGGTLTVFLGNGDGTLRYAGEYPVGPRPTVPAVGDFNNDGINDLAVGSWIDGSVTIFLGKGDGTFGEPRKFVASIQAACVAVGHFSSDGNLDIAVANVTQNEVVILLGSGDGTFHEARSFPTKPNAEVPRPAGPWWGVYDILVADFNEDGLDDLAVTNFSDNNVGILLGRGDGTFGPPSTFATDGGPFSLAFGDFNNDGKIDLVTANNSETISVLLGHGDGTFQQKQTYQTGGSSTSIVVGDFNGDGKPDLAIASRDKNFFGLMLNSKDVVPTFTRLYVIGTTSTQGFPVTIKAVVTSAEGTPAGRVELKTENETLTTQSLKSGELVFTTSSLRKGSHTVTAEFQGSDRFSRSSARAILNVQ
jgi:hypothetical protein